MSGRQKYRCRLASNCTNPERDGTKRRGAQIQPGFPKHAAKARTCFKCNAGGFVVFHNDACAIKHLQDSNTGRTQVRQGVHASPHSCARDAAAPLALRSTRSDCVDLVRHSWMLSYATGGHRAGIPNAGKARAARLGGPAHQPCASRAAADRPAPPRPCCRPRAAPRCSGCASRRSSCGAGAASHYGGGGGSSSTGGRRAARA